MSSTHSSSHHSSSSKSKYSSFKSTPKKGNCSEIADPAERRRVQNRIAQRNFRDKAKETKERSESDAENQAHAGYSYHTPDPSKMGTDDELSGLSWGSISLKHVVSEEKTKEESRRRSKSQDRIPVCDQELVYDQRGAYREADATYYEDLDRAYCDCGSGVSGYGGSSR